MKRMTKTDIKPIKALCDKGCKREFNITKFDEKEIKPGIIETYFRCPHCYQKYTCFYTNFEIRAIQKKMRDRKLKLHEFEKMKELVTIMMNNLKKEIEGKSNEQL